MLLDMEETVHVIEWRIENFSCWCAKVHGDCIESPKSRVNASSTMKLYPKGASGQGEHLVVRFWGDQLHYSGEISFYRSDGALLCKQPVNEKCNGTLEELPPPGPKFEDVLSGMSEDFITVRLRMKNPTNCEEGMYTTINACKLSLKMNPKWIEEIIETDEEKRVCGISFSPNCDLDGMWLHACSINTKVQFLIKPPIQIKPPFAVEMCTRLKGIDGTVDSCAKKERVFHNNNPWRYPETLVKKELVGKEISLFLVLKTKDIIQCYDHLSFDDCSISILPNTFVCLPDKETVTDPVTSRKTEDSVEVLIKDFMCLYQDQDFSDITLKCDNVTFPVHKNILSARSPVFKTMLSTDMKETVSGTVDIGDLDPSSLGLFLTFLYVGAVEDLQDSRALNLYYAADKYQVPSLKKKCAEFLCDNVSVSSVCDILSLADRHGDDQLTSVAREFIQDNFNDVLKSKEWESFMCRESLLAVKTVTHFASKDMVFVRKHDSK